jgi:hypothetical protein
VAVSEANETFTQFVTSEPQYTFLCSSTQSGRVPVGSNQVTLYSLNLIK